MAITAISVLRRDPALANASGLIAGTTGRDGDPGKQGNPGGPGGPGPTGRGISSASVSDSGRLILTYTDGASADAGAVSYSPTAAIPVPASENLAAGALVNLYTASGVVTARNADASVSSGGKKVSGFVISAVASGGTAAVYRTGLNTSVSNLSPGADYYLGTSPGTLTTTPPSASGQTQQYVGVAISATSIDIEPASFVGIA